jgi:hypothetical protein
VELGHDFASEQLERLADVVVPVLAALLDEDRLVHAGILEDAEHLAELRRRADAAGAGAERLGPDLIAHGLVAIPDVRAPRRVLAEHVMMRQRELEEPEAVVATARGSAASA